MSSVTSTNSSNAAFDAINAAAQAGKSTTSATKDSEDRFLRLLTTQLTNQDPLNPMDNAQMTSQLAQMSTVSGIERLNATLDTLLGSISNSQTMQAAAMIGKNVLVPGKQLALTKGEAYGGISLSGAADQVVLKIMDSTGKVVQTQNLGAQEAGVLNFGWDGKDADDVQLADGNYTFTVEAIQGASKVTAEALQIGTVSALVRSSNGFLLDLGALGTVDFDDVQQIL